MADRKPPARPARRDVDRKAGQLLIEMAERGERAIGGEAGRREFLPVTLADLGVTKKQSHYWQRLAEGPQLRHTRRARQC
jgi:hypothetical protein